MYTIKPYRANNNNNNNKEVQRHNNKIVCVFNIIISIEFQTQTRGKCEKWKVQNREHITCS